MTKPRNNVKLFMDVISYYVSCESGNDRVIFQFQRKIYDCHRCAILWGFDIPTNSTLESENKIAQENKTVTNVSTKTLELYSFRFTRY